MPRLTERMAERIRITKRRVTPFFSPGWLGLEAYEAKSSQNLLNAFLISDFKPNILRSVLDTRLPKR